MHSIGFAVTTDLFTIGHSTRALDEFLVLLSRHRIDLLADVRRIPGSRKYPHFNRESLAAALEPSGVEYRWFESLGGRRGKQPGPSPNTGLRNESFRNYADYMATPVFRAAAADLLDVARTKRVALTCSEAVYWRCHRRLVSDFLTGQGIEVRHIMPAGELKAHLLTERAQFLDDEVTYPGPAANGPSLFE